MLLDEIIGLLGDEKASLTEALLKTKILLRQIGKKELAEWVNNELNGYPDNSELPLYRVLLSQVMANVSNMAWRAEQQPIPIQHLDKEYLASLENCSFRQSLAVVEKNAFGEGKFIRRIPMDAYHLFNKGLSNGFRAEGVWCETSKSDVLNILVQVRSRLLDFMLDLKDTVGPTTTESELKDKSKSIDANSLFANAIFGSGSNTTILIGHHSSIAATQTISAGEFAEGIRILVDQLEKALPPSDLPSAMRAETAKALAELRDAAAVPAPDVGRLRRGLESLKHIMEHAAGHVVAAGALGLIEKLLTHAAY
jgi:hypothetical protein